MNKRIHNSMPEQKFYSTDRVAAERALQVAQRALQEVCVALNEVERLMRRQPD